MNFLHCFQTWTRSDALKALFFISIFLSYLFVLSRLFIQRKINSFHVSDIFLLASLFVFSTYIISGFLSIIHGIGSSRDEVTDSPTLSQGLKYYFISELTSILTLCLLRIAVALHFRDLTKTSVQRWILLGVTVATSLLSVLYFVAVLLQCRPIQYFWTGWLGGDGICVDLKLMALAGFWYAKVNAAADWMLALFPVWMFWGEDMSRKVLVWRQALMTLGVCAGVAAVLRISGTRKLVTTDDFFSDCVPIVIGSIVEPTLGIIALSAASFGSMRPVVKSPAGPPLPLMLPRANEKRALMSSSYRDQAALTGENIPSRQSSFRKFSPDRIPDMS